MRRCIDLAGRAAEYTAPNPMVACVIVKDDVIVAEGFHERFGEPHAEVNAIHSLPTSIHPEDCDLYVNLEPCSHYGKTPPCADLILKKGFKKIYVGHTDPNPQVAGKGIQKLRDAGISVETGILEKECRELNHKFLTFHQKKRPYISLKWAQTADGFMARKVKDKALDKQISNKHSNILVHKLRAGHMGIMIGAATANLDNPMLNLRHWPGRDPLKIVISGTGSVQNGLRLFENGHYMVYSTVENPGIEHQHILESENFMQAVMQDLFEKNIQSILVEGGRELLQYFLDQELWDEIYVITSEKNWENGIKAPLIQSIADDSFQYKSDTIYHYKAI